MGPEAVINKSLAELSRALQSKETSSVDLTRAFLERMDTGQGLNAFITVDGDRALEQARAADARIARGDAGSLTGMPLAHKDIFCTKGLLTTCGSKILSNFVAPYNATLIERFNQAGAVILGKTTTDKYAMRTSNDISYFGVAEDPCDRACVPVVCSCGSPSVVSPRLRPPAHRRRL